MGSSPLYDSDLCRLLAEEFESSMTTGAMSELGVAHLYLLRNCDAYIIVITPDGLYHTSERIDAALVELRWQQEEELYSNDNPEPEIGDWVISYNDTEAPGGAGWYVRAFLTPGPTYGPFPKPTAAYQYIVQPEFNPPGPVWIAAEHGNYHRWMNDASF